MLDQDLQRFAEGLHQTKAGFRLRMAIHESHIAISQIERLRSLGGPHRMAAIDSWQQAYIRACDVAANAIDQLWDSHQWPTDGARVRGYVWHPATHRRR